MRVLAARFVYLYVLVFVSAVAALMLIIPRYFPPPSADNFDHPVTVTGAYHFRAGISSRALGAAWVNNTMLSCSPNFMGSDTCLGKLESLRNGEIITVKMVSQSVLRGTDTLAMNITAGDREVFRQTPIDFINSWRKNNFYLFLEIALIPGILISPIFLIVWEKLQPSGPSG